MVLSRSPGQEKFRSSGSNIRTSLANCYLGANYTSAQDKQERRRISLEPTDDLIGSCLRCAATNAVIGIREASGVHRTLAGTVS